MPQKYNENHPFAGPIAGIHPFGVCETSNHLSNDTSSKIVFLDSVGDLINLLLHPP